MHINYLQSSACFDFWADPTLCFLSMQWKGIANIKLPSPGVSDGDAYVTTLLFDEH